MNIQKFQKIIAFCRGGVVFAYLLSLWWMASNVPWKITAYPYNGTVLSYPVWSHPTKAAELQVGLVLLRLGFSSVVFGAALLLLHFVNVLAKSDSNKNERT